jgi:hypothetical protein
MMPLNNPEKANFFFEYAEARMKLYFKQRKLFLKSESQFLF